MSNTAALDQEIGRLETLGRWNDALNALWRRVAAVEDLDEKSRTIEHIVSVYRVKLRNEAAAIGAAEKLVEMNPRHQGAVAYLREAYTARRDAAKLQWLDAKVGAAGGGGWFGNLGSSVGGALSSAGAAVGTAAAGVFAAVQAAPVAYEQPAATAPKVDTLANKCGTCRADKLAGRTDCPNCGAPY